MNKTLQNGLLTERQQRELDYHSEHAKKNRYMLAELFSYDVIYQTKKTRRWWNAYWSMYWFLIHQNINKKNVLVVGCGFGEDALRLAKLGANVYAFDLCPESLSIATQLASREKLDIKFDRMAAEKLSYDSGFFDLVLARDILHHVDIPKAMNEIARVAKHEALFVYNEVYSHSFTEKIRRSAFVEKKLYPLLESFVYDNRNPYITEDERKLTESDCDTINQSLVGVDFQQYFYFIVNRVIPEKYDVLNKTDRAILFVCHHLGRYMAGRVIRAGLIRKPA
ncbi:MAG TPA: class I SAM-dependent methyltransferase [Crenotrichaceae bacterium]|nr:class I SAM-dependent methyltransferase [Crenotrichaceae bacterium]